MRDDGSIELPTLPMTTAELWRGEGCGCGDAGH
jgi:hypothetical protein